MFWHRAGYKPNVENVSTHTRRRYRLLPSNNPGQPTPDPNLWLVHYSKAERRDQHPATSLNQLPHVAQVFQMRQLIQRSGQLPRKEFFLYARETWPTIQLPPNLARAGAGQLGHRRGGSVDMQATLEEEEDVSRGDVLDFITPREISRMRYEQHHEWMEEILESPYTTKQIIPSELGLGRKGTLETFTNGFFTAPVTTSHDTVNGKVGKLDTNKTEEFTKHANSKLAEMQADLERMKQEHLRRMEKLRKTTDLGAAERRLRNMNPSDDSYKSVAAQVQSIIGRNIEPVNKINTVSRGGLQDIKPIHEPQHAIQGYPNQYGQPQQPPTQGQQQYQQQRQQPPQQTQPNLQQQAQQHQAQIKQAQAQQPAQATPQVLPQTQAQPQIQVQSQPAAQQATTPAQPTTSATPQPIPEKQDAEPVNNDALDNDDIDMGDLGDTGIDNDNADNNEWDMVNDDPSRNTSQGPDDSQQQRDAESNLQPDPEPNQTQQGFASGNDTPGNDFDMVNDFDDNMDTAGDALADYNVDDDLNLDDSAFGDAFHHHDNSGTSQQDMPEAL